MSEFASLADAGRSLSSMLAERVRGDAEIVAVVPNGVPVAEPIADALGLPLRGATVLRADEPRAGAIPDCSAGAAVIVVDDGVETGTAALLVGSALRERGVERLVLAVPVCPREAEPRLRAAYDEIVAVSRPLVRRDLRWHYADFDTIDEAEAMRRLAAR